MSELAHPSDDRVAALVAALLGVRTDYASAQFDAEIDEALTANRLDVQTARALRFWQRASVQAVEEFASVVLPTVLPALAAADNANRQGADDALEAAAAWREVQPAATAATPAAASAATTAASPRREVTIRYVPGQRRSVKETEQAVRAAFRARSARPDERARREEEEDRDHARAATSA
jgi:hypothetical protein